MNRLQKKCVIATVGIHLLLLTILVVGPGFYNPKPKADNTQVLSVIPANLVDDALNTGVRNATLPAPAPAPAVTVPPPQPVPPTPQVQNPPPTPSKPVEPKPTFTEKLEKFFRSEPKPEPVKPSRTEPKPHQIQVNTTLVTRTASKNQTPSPKPDNPSRDTRALDSAIKNLRKNLSPGTTITMPGESSEAAANYASVVKSIYDAAWTLPDAIAKDENITVKVTIASDGTVISSRIIERSGDAPADASVQRTLDRVTSIGQPFPAGSTDKERTYTIVFNPQVKSSE